MLVNLPSWQHGLVVGTPKNPWKPFTPLIFRKKLKNPEITTKNPSPIYHLRPCGHAATRVSWHKFFLRLSGHVATTLKLRNRRSLSLNLVDRFQQRVAHFVPCEFLFKPVWRNWSVSRISVFVMVIMSRIDLNSTFYAWKVYSTVVKSCIKSVQCMELYGTVYIWPRVQICTRYFKLNIENEEPC